MNIDTLTIIHTGLSFVAMGLGIPAVYKLFQRQYSSPWLAVFLGAAVATTLTGFLFPLSTVTPAVGTGIVATMALVAAYLARYVFRFQGFWKPVYTVCVVLNVYLLYFVAVAQAFGKIEFLHDLAPTLSEPPFAVMQLILLGFFGWLGFKAVRSLRAGGLV